MRRVPPATSADGYFDERVVARYDQLLADESTPAAVHAEVDFLAELTSRVRARALEFGIGTGRIALPLAGRGVSVDGIDNSQSMVARLRAKAGGEAIGVTLGDFSSTRVEGEFSLVYLICNTIMNVTSQAGQVATFRNAAAHLLPGGTFVVKVIVPELGSLPPGKTTVVFPRSKNHVDIDEYDVVNQGLASHHFRLLDGRWEYSAIPFRYVWPAELDLMAEMAGMKLLERWAGWGREPFSEDSEEHVSVWQKPAHAASSRRFP